MGNKKLSGLQKQDNQYLGSRQSFDSDELLGSQSRYSVRGKVDHSARHHTTHLKTPNTV